MEPRAALIALAVEDWGGGGRSREEEKRRKEMEGQINFSLVFSSLFSSKMIF